MVDLFEHLFRLRVVRVLVWMILQCKFTVLLFDVLGGRVFRQVQKDIKGFTTSAGTQQGNYDKVVSDKYIRVRRTNHLNRCTSVPPPVVLRCLEADSIGGGEEVIVEIAVPDQDLAFY